MFYGRAMIHSVQFSVPGDPIGKARPRFTKGGRAYTPTKTRAYEEEIRQACWLEMQERELQPTTRRVSVILTAFFAVPKSFSKVRRSDAEAGIIIPPRPDIDNICKAVLDGCNGIAYEDDKQVWHLAAFKRYCEAGVPPGLTAKIQWDSSSE